MLISYKSNIDMRKLFLLFKEEAPSFLLHSQINPYRLGRYSFIGYRPFCVFYCYEDNVFVKEDNSIKRFKKNPLLLLRELFSEFKLNLKKKFSPLPSGAVGYFSYDFGFLFERIPRKNPKELDIPDGFFGFYDTVITYDHLKKELYIFSSGLPEKKNYLAKEKAKERLKEVVSRLSKLDSFRIKEHPPINSSTGKLYSNFSKEDYLKAIRKAKQYIREGDIYQVNLSQQFSKTTGLSSWQIFSRLSEINPSAFSAFLNCGDFFIISSSPERFLYLRDRYVLTRPMKGTRPRGKNTLEDNYLRRQLLESEKDKAELIMIVDLERNDLGKVCEYGSVRVKSFRDLETYSTVFQTTATIEGLLCKDKDRFDLIRACFPGGSITGCPKIKAMQIIEELEPNRRNIYTGSLGYLSFTGEMDLNILIRTILFKKAKIYFGVGGGIVADSKDWLEYEETLVKAEALIKVLESEKDLLKVKDRNLLDSIEKVPYNL